MQSLHRVALSAYTGGARVYEQSARKRFGSAGRIYRPPPYPYPDPTNTPTPHPTPTPP